MLCFYTFWVFFVLVFILVSVCCSFPRIFGFWSRSVIKTSEFLCVMSMELSVLDDIKSKIYIIRGVQVILDRDLAELYEVEVKYLKRQVKRNIDRFPSEFMFEFTKKEFDDWRCQNVTSKADSKGLRHKPFAFTEQGVSMLSTVLKSKKAIEISIKIIKAFVAMRTFLIHNKDLFSEVNIIASKVLEHDNKISKLFDILDKETLPKKGIFFNGEVFDAHVFISNLIKKARNRIILIDNYINDETLTILSKKELNVNVLIYTKNTSKSLDQDLKKFNEQHKNLELMEFNKSHDRFLIIDDELYHIGASLKDLGKKWFAFSKLSIDLDLILSRLK